MMAFCSNAGPAFLFGIGSQLFPNVGYCWAVWAIHVMSAIIVGILTPGNCSVVRRKITAVSMPETVKRAVITLGYVCGWVVLFRIVLVFLQRWFLWLLPGSGRVLVCGIIELANGCLQLIELEILGQRLTYFALFLGFGGICVWLQTKSVAVQADTRLYLPGKLVQCAATILLCGCIQIGLDPEDRYYFPIWVYAVAAGAMVMYHIFLSKSKNKSGNYAGAGI